MTRASFVRAGITALVASMPLASLLSAQTIRPLIAEHRLKANGQFEVVNPTSYPIDVVVEIRGFVVDERGELKDLPLDPAVHVALSTMSLRIPPQQSRYVAYRATADRLPAWFVLYANCRAPQRQDLKGLDLQIELPHVVYLLPAEKLRDRDLHVRVAKEISTDGKVMLDVQNSSGTFGRLTSIEVKGAGRTVPGPSVPVFPHSHRLVEIAWQAAAPPQRVVLRTRDFKAEYPLAESTVAADESPR